MGYDLYLVAQRVISGGAVSYFGYDGLGSVKFLTGSTGSVTDTYTYDAFGNLIASTGSTSNNYRYTGEQWDPDLGFYYLRARYMNPAIGRFQSMDVYEGGADDPLSLHKYLYARNNVLNGVDPSGRDFTLGGLGEAISIGNSLQSTYNGTVSGVGSALQATIFGIQSGVAADDIVSGFVMDETGISLAIGAYNYIKNFFQDETERDVAAYTLFQEEILAATLVAADDDSYGEAVIDFVPQCFLAGTLVAAEQGPISIEKLNIGDQVWAWNWASNTTSLRPVVNTFVHRRDYVFRLEIGFDTILVTGEHPFYVVGRGWVSAKDLEVGDGMVTGAGAEATLQSIEAFDGDFLVYNIEVATDHDYYVGTEELLTHNATNPLRLAMGIRNPMLAAHHIVALWAKGARVARTVLLAAGTGIKNLNDVRNGVALPVNLKVKVPRFAKGVAHSVIHTDVYYRELEKRLLAATPGRRVAVLRRTARELVIGKVPY